MNAALSPLRHSWAMQSPSPAVSGGGSSYTTVYQDRRDSSAFDSDSDEDEQLERVTEWSEYVAGHQRMRAAQTSRLQKEWRESSSGIDSTNSQREHTRHGEGRGASDLARDALEIPQERIEVCGENKDGVTRGIKGSSSTVVVSTQPCSDARLQAEEMAEIERIEERIKDLTATHSREMAQANDRSDELQRQNAYLESRVSELEGDLEESTSTETGQVAFLNRRISDMRNSHRENMAAAAEEFATLNTRLMEKDEETRKLVAVHEEAMKATEAEISRLKSLLSKLETEQRGSRQGTGEQQQQEAAAIKSEASKVAETPVSGTAGAGGRGGGSAPRSYVAVAPAEQEQEKASSVHGTSETSTSEIETPRTSSLFERGLSVISEGRNSMGGSGMGASNSNHRAKGGILRLPWKDRRSKARRTQSLSVADAAIHAASSEQVSLGTPGDCVDLGAVSGDTENNGQQQNRPPKSATGGGTSERKMKRPLWRTFSRSLSVDAHSSSGGQRSESESVSQGDASACGGATGPVSSGDTSAPAEADKVASGSGGPKSEGLAGNDHESVARSGENLAGELSDATAALSCFSSGSSWPPSGSSSPHGQQDASKIPPKPVGSSGRASVYSDDSGAASSTSTSLPSRVDGLHDGEAPRTLVPPQSGIEGEAMKRESMASKALAAAARAEAEAREKALKALDLLKLAHARVKEVEARAERAMREAEKIAAEARSAEERALKRENEARKAQLAALEQEETAKAMGLRAREQVHSARARAALAEQHLMDARMKTLARVKSEAEELKHMPVSSMVAGGGFHRPNGVSHASHK